MNVRPSSDLDKATVGYLDLGVLFIKFDPSAFQPWNQPAAVDPVSHKGSEGSPPKVPERT